MNIDKIVYVVEEVLKESELGDWIDKDGNFELKFFDLHYEDDGKVDGSEWEVVIKGGWCFGVWVLKMEVNMFGEVSDVREFESWVSCGARIIQMISE